MRDDGGQHLLDTLGAALLVRPVPGQEDGAAEDVVEHVEDGELDVGYQKSGKYQY